MHYFYKIQLSDSIKVQFIIKRFRNYYSTVAT